MLNPPSTTLIKLCISTGEGCGLSGSSRPINVRFCTKQHIKFLKSDLMVSWIKKKEEGCCGSSLKKLN